MPGLSVAFAVLAQSATAPAAAPPPAKPVNSAAAAQPQDCSPAQPKADKRTIVICAQRPNGYRLNPDVMEAKREAHNGGRPRSPYPQAPPPDCATVGPAPCITAGINLIGAALTAAEMAKRLAAGKEIGSMFVTDPHPSEYQLYLDAKKRREAEEAETAAAAKARAAAAAKANGSAHSTQPQPASPN